MDNRLRPESKKHIVRCAKKVLIRDGVDGFNVRQVARECDASVSGLYRHFSGRDELLLYASLMSLDDYFKTLTGTFKIEQSSITNLFETEKVFAEYSFSEPELFYNLYFSMQEEKYDEIFQDCFSLFENSPEELFQLSFGKNFIKGGLYGRNLAMLELCHEEGFINLPREELPLFNTCLISMYRGFMDNAIAMKKRGEDASSLLESYLASHRMLFRPILNPQKNENIL